MPTDLNQGYNDANKQIQGIQTYNQVSTDLKDLQNRANSSMEEANSAISNSLSEVEKLKNKAQQQVQSQFDQMIKPPKSARQFFMGATRNSVIHFTCNDCSHRLNQYLVQIARSDSELGSIQILGSVSFLL